MYILSSVQLVPLDSIDLCLSATCGAVQRHRHGQGPEVGEGGPCADVTTPSPTPFLRDIAKNALLRWRVFIYWVFLGVFDALVFFFSAYFMFENTTVTSNGQVSTKLDLIGFTA